MQPLLSSSKRFLVSQNDFASLQPYGSVEYLIEFRLHDMDNLGTFEADYTTTGLESNGPTLTYPLFRIFNGLSDELMIAVILLVSALVIVIALLCIRFTLLAKIEDDYREIGVMKAIGLRVADIKKIYLTQYLAIAAVGSLLGYGLSFVFRDAPTLQMGKTLQPSHYGVLFNVKKANKIKFYEIRYPHKRCRKCGHLQKDYGGKKAMLHPFGPLVSDV